MIKKSKSYSKRYRWITLYREDLVEIYDAIKAVNNKVELQLDDYQLESITEISQIQTYTIKKIAMNTRDPYISVDFDSDQGARIYISDDSDPLSFGCAAKIEAILAARYSVVSKWLYSTGRQVLLYLGFMIGILLVLTYLILSAKREERIADLNKFRDIGNYLIYGGILGYFPITFCIDKIGKDRECRIYNSNRNATPGFFIRKKDDIVISSISTIVGAVIGYIVGKM